MKLKSKILYAHTYTKHFPDCVEAIKHLFSQILIYVTFSDNNYDGNRALYNCNAFVVYVYNLFWEEILINIAQNYLKLKSTRLCTLYIVTHSTVVLFEG